ncbi:hypothetical protein C9J41_06270 [Photobacterium sp. GB-50]|nr:hypothetical protein [Photobacterium sp. GB-50]PSW74473.1 hypothetical protein C9J41_06270 [Photobacterium sp. GB-50]
MTESESQFEITLDDKNIKFQKIPETEGKTPDYEVYLGNHLSYWEIKELIENPSEKQVLRDIEGECLGIYQVNSDRVVNSIKDAAKQLKNYGESKASRVIVLCDSRDFATMDFLFIPSIQEVMLGKAEYYAHRDGSLEEIKRYPGLLTNRMKYISAIAVLSVKTGKMLFLHNPNATVPLFETDLVKHFDNHQVFEKNGRTNTWQQV